jgi:hypothetical protein
LSGVQKQAAPPRKSLLTLLLPRSTSTSNLRFFKGLTMNRIIRERNSMQTAARNIALG